MWAIFLLLANAIEWMTCKDLELITSEKWLYTFMCEFTHLHPTQNRRQNCLYEPGFTGGWYAYFKHTKNTCMQETLANIFKDWFNINYWWTLYFAAFLSPGLNSTCSEITALPPGLGPSVGSGIMTLILPWQKLWRHCDVSNCENRIFSKLFS